MAGILCSGNIVFDILVRPVGAIEWGTTLWVDNIVRGLGGNGANTSYAAGMLGAPVRLLGMVGRDSLGSEVLGILTRAGVDVGLVGRSETSTATTVALVRRDGARAFLHNLGVSRESFLEPVDFTAQVASGCSHYHMANPFAMPGTRAHASVWLERARSAGLRTSLDTGWDASGEWMAVLGPCLPYLDILFANEDEARILSGREDPPQIAAFFQDRGAADFVLKLGAQGCMVFRGGEAVSVPAFPVDAVDSTGAGDCFVGGFLAGLLMGYSLVEAARLANAAGALSIQELGAVTGMRNLDQTLQWMDERRAGSNVRALREFGE